MKKIALAELFINCVASIIITYEHNAATKKVCKLINIFLKKTNSCQKKSMGSRSEGALKCN